MWKHAIKAVCMLVNISNISKMFLKIFKVIPIYPKIPPFLSYNKLNKYLFRFHKKKHSRNRRQKHWFSSVSGFKFLCFWRVSTGCSCWALASWVTATRETDATNGAAWHETRSYTWPYPHEVHRIRDIHCKKNICGNIWDVKTITEKCTTFSRKVLNLILFWNWENTLVKVIETHKSE